jgi:hypothetical protein
LWPNTATPNTDSLSEAARPSSASVTVYCSSSRKRSELLKAELALILASFS